MALDVHATDYGYSYRRKDGTPIAEAIWVESGERSTRERRICCVPYILRVEHHIAAEKLAPWMRYDMRVNSLGAAEHIALAIDEHLKEEGKL